MLKFYRCEYCHVVKCCLEEDAGVTRCSTCASQWGVPLEQLEIVDCHGVRCSIEQVSIQQEEEV